MNNWKKVFGIIWTGQFFSLLSSSIVNFAIIIWISLQTGSAAVLAWAAIAGLLPQGILSPFVGVFIDRWNRKKVMMLADGFIALCTLVLAFLFWTGVIEIWHIFVILALRSVGSTFHMPAMQASIPLLAPAEQITRIAGISQIINSVSSIAGPALGALFVITMDMQYILLLDVGGALLAVTSLMFVDIPDPEKKEKPEKPHVFKEIKEGVQAVLKNRGLAWAFLFTFIACMIYMPLNTLFPLLTLKHFGGSEFQVGLIQILWGIGFLVGGALIGMRVYTKMNRIVMVNLMYITMGIVFFMMGNLSQNAFIIYSGLAVIGGAAASVFLSLFTAIVQTKVEPAALGRVFSMYYTLSILPTLLSLVATGFFADAAGISVSFIIFGILMILCGVLAFVPRSSLNLDRNKHV